MFLKRIIAHGFKSFADRTDIEFARGMTGIVGPNGCGKSNVLDAIRWVLGEQSARLLRGGRMLDVVFSGSRSRKPANFAEVTLVFGASQGTLSADQDEVSVGRVLYRSGDSEYKINGQSVRLKDVRELFLDTGIGVDAYSVIAQGRVDAMLQANPQQRRELFEEAAGVSRYKLRRIEAQRKLERSQNNLLRINDIIEELERRLRSVKLAAAKARKFQEYDAQLRELRAAFSLSEYHEHTRSLARIRTRAASLTDLVAAKRVELAARDSEAVALDAELLKRDAEIREIEGELAAAQAEISGLAERVTQIERRESELRESRDESARRAEELAGTAAALAKRHTDMSAELTALRDEESAGLAAVDTARAALAVAQEQADAARQSLQSGQATVFDAAREVARVDNQRSAAEQDIEALADRLTQIEARSQQLVEAGDSAAAEERRCEERVRHLEQKAETAAETLGRVERDLAEVRAQVDATESRLSEAADQRSAARSRLELLLDMERRQEGVAQGSRALLKWRDLHPDGGVVGIVADLLRVDPDYVAALRPLLTRIENRVVVREQDAFIAALREHGEPDSAVDVVANDRCRRTAAGQAEMWRGREGVLGLAVDAVRVDAGFEAALDSLLGDVVLVDSLDRALRLSAEGAGRWTFVAPNGAIVRPDGRISMGVGEGGGGLISRRLEIARLESDLETLERALDEATRARAGLRSRAADLQVERDAIQNGVAQTQREIGAARAELRRAADECARFTRERESLAGEGEALGSRLSRRREDATRLAAELEQAVARRAEVERQLGALEAGVSAALDAVRTHGDQATAAQVAAGRIQERREARQAALDELSRQAQSIEREREGALRAIEEAARRLEAARRDLVESRERAEALQSSADLMREKALGLREQREAVRRKTETRGAVARRLQSEIGQVDAGLTECEVARREIEVRVENLIGRVREELELDLVELYASYEHSDRDWAAVREEIDDLRGRITRLGNVNLDSISELEELQPRYDHHITQRDDLTDAIGKLQTLIEELDEESRTRFVACFEEVRVAFQELFRKLFGGGKADIILETPDDPLESGIEIIARPPGKEPQSISLLSGGEKTMTAVALLFAVFKRKPSPFAILDEVDAALDDSNIERFNNMLQEFLVESQFIVITHNKATMQRADVLHGITMQEPGVSKRVSVRFEDRVHTPEVA